MSYFKFLLTFDVAGLSWCWRKPSFKFHYIHQSNKSYITNSCKQVTNSSASFTKSGGNQNWLFSRHKTVLVGHLVPLSLFSLHTSSSQLMYLISSHLMSMLKFIIDPKRCTYLVPRFQDLLNIYSKWSPSVWNIPHTQDPHVNRYGQGWTVGFPTV